MKKSKSLTGVLCSHNDFIHIGRNKGGDTCCSGYTKSLLKTPKSSATCNHPSRSNQDYSGFLSYSLAALRTKALVIRLSSHITDKGDSGKVYGHRYGDIELDCVHVGLDRTRIEKNSAMLCFKTNAAGPSFRQQTWLCRPARR